MTEWDDPFEQSEFLLEAINEVRSDKDVSEYNFLDKIEDIHPAPSKKGNAGLSNAYAELAIYEEDGELVVDEELVRELDSRLAERDGVNKRHRFESIIMNSDKRPGKKTSLLENQVNGHERLKNRIREFYEATGREEEFEKYADGGLLTQNDISSKTDSENNQGGENKMGLTEEVSQNAQDYMDEGMGAIEAYEAAIDDYDDALNEADSKFQSIETALRQELLAVNVKGGDLERVIGHLEGKIDSRRDNLSDTMDSIRASYDNITDR